MRGTHTTILTIDTPGKALVECTREVEVWLADKVTSKAAGDGLLTLFCRHTSASLLIQENAAAEVKTDLLGWFAHAVPEDADYAHDDEGPDDMPAHIRAALTQVHLSIPVLNGKLALGTWQGIYLFEHRDAPHRREIALHFAGD